MNSKELEATKFIVRLSEVTAEDQSRVGHKAANEGELHRAGFKVPDGFVLTVDAFQHFLELNEINFERGPEFVANANLPEELLSSLQDTIAGLNLYPLAVRSSGIVEDLPGASFAGQYESTLNVKSEEALEEAVLCCWESAFKPHVAAYREERGLPADGVAVLVQKMVPADVSGVAFSADPLSGDRHTIVVNAVQGLGERLVSGEVSPDEWVIKDEEAHCRRAPEGAIDAEQVKLIAEMARDVESHFGTPQDIEWAIADDQLYVLQARPITALPAGQPELVPIPIEPPPGFWQQDATRAPHPPCPMMWVVLEVAEPGIELMAAEFGLLTDGQEFALIGGWLYNRLKPLGGKEPPAVQLPKPIMKLMIQLVPMMRARIKKAVEAIRGDKAGHIIHQWYDEWLTEIDAEIAYFREMKLEELSKTALIQHFEEVLGFTRKMIGYHALVGTSVNLLLYELAATCQELLGWEEAQAFELVSGTSYKSTEPAVQLHELAIMAKENIVVVELLQDIDERTVDHLMDVDPEFAQTFNKYQEEYGCRTLRLDIRYPSLAERPTFTLSLIRDQIENSYDPAKAEAEWEQQRSHKAAEGRVLLANQQEELTRFERVLERAKKAYPLREANQFYTFSAPMALIRYTVLEIGSRLASRGVIEERDDAFFLHKEEACLALTEGVDQKELVQIRKGEMAWAEANPGPDYYGEPPVPPSFDFLPAEARLIMESLIWSFEQMMEYENSNQVQAAGETLKGIAASVGEYTGTARIIMDEREFHKIHPGDVMVCPMTSPVWSVLFPSLGALVTNSGGLLSHPAIIAREYKIPAVVATGNATAVLQDGDLVKVNGAEGTVEVIA